MPVFVTVASGAGASGIAVLPRGDRPIAIVVASHIARSWGVSFSVDNGSTFQAYRKLDGTATPFVIASGAGDMMGVIEFPASKRLRLDVGSLVETTSVRIVELNRA